MTVSVLTLRILKYLSEYRASTEKIDRLKLSDIEIPTNSGINGVIYDFLNSLSEEEIREIQAIMYLGRGGCYSDYQEAYTDLEKLGWRDKNLEINQICEKSPLPKYLTEGCRKMGIDI